MSHALASSFLVSGAGERGLYHLEALSQLGLEFLLVLLFLLGHGHEVLNLIFQVTGLADHFVLSVGCSGDGQESHSK